ncbi:MAG TPA: hypothetical protein V6D11_11950 [Waterburya sp.]
MGVCTEAELALRQGSLIPLEIPKTDELTGRLEQVAQVSCLDRTYAISVEPAPLTPQDWGKQDLYSPQI